MDLAYMAALLEAAGHECRIRDFAASDGDWSQVSAELDSFAPQALMVSTRMPASAAAITAAVMGAGRV